MQQENTTPVEHTIATLPKGTKRKQVAMNTSQQSKSKRQRLSPSVAESDESLDSTQTFDSPESCVQI